MAESIRIPVESLSSRVLAREQEQHGHRLTRLRSPLSVSLSLSLYPSIPLRIPPSVQLSRPPSSLVFHERWLPPIRWFFSNGLWVDPRKNISTPPPALLLFSLHPRPACLSPLLLFLFWRSLVVLFSDPTNVSVLAACLSFLSLFLTGSSRYSRPRCLSAFSIGRDQSSPPWRLARPPPPIPLLRATPAIL